MINMKLTDLHLQNKNSPPQISFKENVVACLRQNQSYFKPEDLHKEAVSKKYYTLIASTDIVGLRYPKVKAKTVTYVKVKTDAGFFSKDLKFISCPASLSSYLNLLK